VRPRPPIPVLVVAAALLAAGAAWLLHTPSTLTVHVPLDWAAKEGYVAGFAQVIAASPAGTVEKTVYLDLAQGHGGVDIALPVKSLLAAAKAPNSGSVALATVHVNLYLYDREGRLCLSAATLDTLQYLYRRMGAAREAWDAAVHDPLQLLRAGSLEMPSDLFTPCIPVGNVLDKLLQPKLREILGDTRRSLQPAGGTLPVGTRLMLVNEELYSSRDNPPRLWLKRVVNNWYWPRTAPQLARQAWGIFANRYSYALLVPKYYSFATALRAAARWYHLVHWRTSQGQEAVYGVATMTDFINALLDYTVPGLAWRDTYPYGAVLRHFDRAPLLVVKAACPTCNTIDLPEIEAMFMSGIYDSVEAGLSFLGVIVWPVSRTNLYMNGEGVIVELTKTPDEEAIYTPMDDVYLHDGIVVLLYAKEVERNGQDYWMFLPLVDAVPIHYYRFEYSRMQPTDTITPDMREALNYMLQQATETGSFITPSTYTKYMLVYDNFHDYMLLDSFTIEESYSNTLAAFLAYCGNIALWSAVSAIVPPAYALLPELASTLTSIAYADAHAAKTMFKLRLKSGHTGHYIELYVEKYTQRYASVDVLPPGYHPTLVEYTVLGRDLG